MNRKRILTLVLALVFIVALFAGCAGNTGTTGGGTTENSGTADNSGSTSGGSTSGSSSSGNTSSGSSSSGSSETTEPAETTEPVEESPYKFAAGKFAADANGVALEPYEYDRPFCTTDEVLVYWNVCYTPMYIPEEGMRSMPYQQEVEQFTGVQVEYLAPAAETKQEAFSVMIAADDLPDMMAHGLTYYGKSANDAISEGWFANIYDYREYAPNYFFQADNYTQRVHDTIYYSDDQVVWFYGILKNPTPATGLCMRGDWLDKLGVNPDDLETCALPISRRAAPLQERAGDPVAHGGLLHHRAEPRLHVLRLQHRRVAESLRPALRPPDRRQGSVLPDAG